MGAQASAGASTTEEDAVVPRSSDVDTSFLPGPLTDAKQKYDRAAKRARVQELAAYAAAEGSLDGITKEEAIRQIRFHARPAKLLQARAEIYALNELMRERDKQHFEEFVRSRQ